MGNAPFLSRYFSEWRDACTILISVGRCRPGRSSVQRSIGPRVGACLSAPASRRRSRTSRRDDTIFTGSDGRVHATRAADGKQLWSAPAPGKVTDLAFHAGRLFVVTDGDPKRHESRLGIPGGWIACFAAGGGHTRRKT